MTGGVILIEYKFLKSQVLRYFGRSIIMALRYLFPDVDLDDSKFLRVLPKRKRAKTFFAMFAQQHKFDPLNPENWYKVKPYTLWRSGKVFKEISYFL